MSLLELSRAMLGKKDEDCLPGMKIVETFLFLFLVLNGASMTSLMENQVPEMHFI